MIKKILVSVFILTFTTFSAAFADISNEAKLYYNQGVDTYRNGQYNQAIDSEKLYQ